MLKERQGKAVAPRFTEFRATRRLLARSDLEIISNADLRSSQCEAREEEGQEGWESYCCWWNLLMKYLCALRIVVHQINYREGFTEIHSHIYEGYRTIWTFPRGLHFIRDLFVICLPCLSSSTDMDLWVRAASNVCGGFFTGSYPPVFPPRRFTIPPMYHERGSNSSGDWNPSYMIHSMTPVILTTPVPLEPGVWFPLV